MMEEAERRWVADQLGRSPLVPVGVAARCPAGHPCVVSCAPLARVRGKVTPFPTFYWLICPAVCRAVAHLERDGAIAQIETRLESDAALRERVARDHEDYIARRIAALSGEERLLVEQDAALREALMERGIGGMASRAAVKCLHLHVAHHLVSGNAIGEIVMRELGVRTCG